jgi:hypothetical protein
VAGIGVSIGRIGRILPGTVCDEPRDQAMVESSNINPLRRARLWFLVLVAKGGTPFFGEFIALAL